MEISKSTVIISGIILLCLLVSACLYPKVPERMATHWNAKGQVDGYMPKSAGVFLMPGIMVFIAVLFKLIPRIDPLKLNYEKFRNYYDGFVIVFLLFMLGLQYFMLLWNIGIKLRLNIIIPIGIGFLFFFIGILCEHVKKNWFVGIRTPWTLSSDAVWDKTHRIGGRLFKITGLIVIGGIFFEKYILFFILVPVLVITVFLLVYSYLEYQKEKA
jgi:uncharacterized membrane protein